MCFGHHTAGSYVTELEYLNYSWFWEYCVLRWFGYVERMDDRMQRGI